MVQFTAYTVFSILPQWQTAMLGHDVVALQVIPLVPLR